MVDLDAHCRFFNQLADLVDPRYYHAEEREPHNPKFMKRDAAAAAKQAFKEARKANKLARLDPDGPKTTTQLQAQQREAVATDGGSVPVPALGTLRLPAAGTGAPSREELLRRLHAKMEVARAARHAKAPAEGPAAQQGPGESAKAWRKAVLGRQLKARQQQVPAEGQEQEQQGQQAAGKRRQQQPAGEQQHGAAAKRSRTGVQPDGQQQGAAAPAAVGGGQLVFNALALDADAGRPGARKDKGPKASKEAALRAAEERAARLADAAQRQDRELLAAEAWRSALSRAAGDKVLDDPKLLRRSIKRDQKDRARKGKRWAERVASQQEQQRSRQERRKENLAARATTKLENKKAKREKKLLRAGFEGRKTGFINAKTT